MAEIAASIIGIAGAGVSVVSALTKFSISIRGSSEKINALASRVSLTASILSDIATTIEGNEGGFRAKEFTGTWEGVLRGCEASYEKIGMAVGKARRRGGGTSDGDGKVTVWGKLVWALGGEGEMRDLEAGLERCCQQVMMMQQAVQMSVLSLIDKRCVFKFQDSFDRLLLMNIEPNSVQQKQRNDENSWEKLSGYFET